MSKKIIYIIISVLLGLVLIGVVGYYYSTKNTSSENRGGVTSVFKNFFPFGGNDTPLDNDNDSDNEEPVDNNNENKPVEYILKLRKISAEPVAGAGLLDVKAGTIVRYIEKATGHIFEVELFSPRQGRISNTTIPQVYDAVWGNSNNSLIARYLKEDDETVDTYSLTVKETSTTTENIISGIPFPTRIDNVDTFGNSVFYLEKNENGSSGYISNFSAGNKKQIWSSPIREVIPQYVNAKTVSLTTKPEENTYGFLYFVDTGTGSVKKILGNVPGLSTLTSRDGASVIYLMQGGNAEMFALSVKNKTVAGVSPTTLPEKCAWSKKDVDVVYCAVPREDVVSGVLTSWYKGQISFTDDIWKFDLKNNTSTIILNSNKETEEPLDIVKPLVSDNEQYFVFINKRDNSLWSLDLTK